MKRALFAVMALGLTTGLMANDAVELTGKVVEYGKLSQPTNAAAVETIKVKRTAATPKKVELKYELNYVVPSCTEYEVQYADVPALTQTNCEANLDKSYNCEEVTFEGFQIPKRVCVKEGFTLKSQKQSLTLDFKKAVVLTENADEVFEINIKQKDMKETKTSLKGAAFETDSVYKVKARRGKLRFIAK